MFLLKTLKNVSQLNYKTFVISALNLKLNILDGVQVPTFGPQDENNYFLLKLVYVSN